MQPRPDEWNWLDASETISAAELSQACGLSDAELQELVGYGAVQPLKEEQGGNIFSASCGGISTSIFSRWRCWRNTSTASKPWSATCGHCGRIFRRMCSLNIAKDPSPGSSRTRRRPWRAATSGTADSATQGAP